MRASVSSATLFHSRPNCALICMVGGDPAADTAGVLVRVEVRNFYPWLRGKGPFARFGGWLYSQTQLRIHILVCNAFLRSLTRTELLRPPSG
jgi:hypothetical protein